MVILKQSKEKGKLSGKRVTASTEILANIRLMQIVKCHLTM